MDIHPQQPACLFLLLCQIPLKMASHFQVVFLLCFTGGLLFEGATSTSNEINVPGDCPSGWTGFGSRSFIYQAVAKDAADAEVTCISLGGNLASIHSAEEHEFVRDLIRKNSGSDTRTWIGGHDLMKESTWMWSDGSKFDYNAWAKGQPDNAGKKEHCVETNFRDPYWNDHKCSETKPFICAKPLGMTVYFRTN